MKRFELRHAAVALAAALALGGTSCTQKPATPGPEQPGQLTPVDLGPNHPTINPLPDPEQNGGHAGRAPRRISVAQLKQSILVTTGRQWSQIDNLASSLGQADYAITVSDSTEANLVFAKFLEDGAREVCLAVASADLGRANPADRVLTQELPMGTSRDFTTLDDATIQKNLGYLSLRFWGSALEASELADWTTTFKTIAARAKAANRPEQAWGAMCVAMMTDPRFFTY